MTTESDVVYRGMDPDSDLLSMPVGPKRTLMQALRGAIKNKNNILESIEDCKSTLERLSKEVSQLNSLITAYEQAIELIDKTKEP